MSSNMLEETYGIIQGLAGRKACMNVPRVFVQFCKGYHAAVMLAQLMYHTEVEQAAQWSPHTYEDLADDLALTYDQVREAKARLEKLGVIETCVRKLDGTPMMHYRVVPSRVVELVREAVQAKKADPSPDGPGPQPRSTWATAQNQGPGPQPRSFMIETEETSSRERGDPASPAAPRPEPPAPLLLEVEGTTPPSPVSLIWSSYEAAYTARYKCAPVRNAKVNGIIAQLIKRVGFEDAVQMVAWFVEHRHRWYVEKGHALSCLLADAEKLHTEWKAGVMLHSRDASEIDRLSSQQSMWARVQARIDERKRQQNGGAA